MTNIYRLIISGVLTVHKYYNDFFYDNAFVACLIDIPLHQLNQMEVQFLSILDFALSVHEEEYEAYSNMVVLFCLQNSSVANQIELQLLHQLQGLQAVTQLDDYRTMSTDLQSVNHYPVEFAAHSSAEDILEARLVEMEQLGVSVGSELWNNNAPYLV